MKRIHQNDLPHPIQW